MRDDWRQIERDLVDVFRRLGFRTFVRTEYASGNSGTKNGEWLAGPTSREQKELNLSEIARELAALR